LRPTGQGVTNSFGAAIDGQFFGGGCFGGHVSSGRQFGVGEGGLGLHERIALER
jgi:hypothetical protein